MSYIFKKGTVVTSDYCGDTFLLDEDYDYRTDKPIPYRQWWSSWKHKHRDKLKIHQQYDDWNGGRCTVDQSDCLHLASYKFIKLLKIPKEYLADELKHLGI